ncbi:MAG TPA: PQQ-dependent dehydrogenase, methanol/ethanol family [Steroidobacteraceae bacterium]|nr:PQQ-dependent dehydrogenase, methanol/ethanol family [Steroidobacteraceae bacterium]
MNKVLSLFLVAALGLTLARVSLSAPGSESTDSANAADWPSWGRLGDEQHYSPLDQVSTGNVAKLSLAWHYDLPSENTLTGPVEADGKLFVTTGHSYIRAFDAASGKLLWEYDSHTREAAGLSLRFGWGPKGIAYWNGHVFVATQEGRIISLGANTGKEAWMQRDFDPKELRYINGPPRIFGGKLIIGHGGADISPIRGYVTAYDATTGKRLWRFYTVPGNPSFDHDETTGITASTWKGEWWKQGGGGTAWNAFSYDPDLDLIYIGVGNGYPYNQALRSPGGGDNLFLASIVAVKADTGKYVWHYQVCNGEQWDCTAVHDMTLATVKIDGQPRKVLMEAPKNGFFYVLDRATGQLLSAKPFAKVTWATEVDPKTGRPVENPGIRYHDKPGMFELWPSVRGAHSWLPQSYSPQTGLVYIPVIEAASYIGDEGVDLQHQPPIGGMAVKVFPDADLPGARKSFLKAWDPVAQKARWSVELPGDWPGGTMATGGHLVFQGRIDGKFAAYDDRDGKLLWSFDVGAPVVAPPITYKIGSTQYVTVLSGSGASGGGLFAAGDAPYATEYRLPRRVLTFVLNGRDKLPPTEVQPLKAPVDPGFQPDQVAEAAGSMVYTMSGCVVCHGPNAVGGGSAPDLRVSGFPSNKEAFHAALQGALVTKGMPAFPEITDDKVEAIRQYLRARGQQIGTPQANDTGTSMSGPIR